MQFSKFGYQAEIVYEKKNLSLFTIITNFDRKKRQFNLLFAINHCMKKI